MIENKSILNINDKISLVIKITKLFVVVLFLQLILASCSQSVRFTSTKVTTKENLASTENKKSDKESRAGKSKRASDNVKKNTNKLDLSNNPTIANDKSNDNSYNENHFNPYKPIPKKSSKINAENENEINEQGELIVHASSKWLGTPYQYGGTTEDGIDCSALTQNSYSEVGIAIPRTSAEQYEYCDLIEPDERKVGDLVFFAKNTTISHVGIYAGENEVIHASTSQGVIKQSIYSPFLFNNFVSFGRVNKSMSMR